MKKTAILFASMLSFVSTLCAQNTDVRQLYDNFVTPPQSVAPRVWWHWMNGNITKDGLRKDLMWMKRSGIGGFHVFDAGMETPQVVKNRLIYMTPEWKDAFHYAIALGDSLGMEMTVASSPGWSVTGGPWVKPENAMKRIEWRQTDIVGGKKISLKLPDGFDNYGAYLDSKIASSVVDKKYDNSKFYRDIAVLAVKLPDVYKTLAEMNPKITTSGGNVTLEQLSNESISDYSTLTPEKDGVCWVQFEFPQAETIRSFTYSTASLTERIQGIDHEVWTSDDGKNFKKVLSPVYQANIVKAQNITPTKAKYFRFTIKNTNAADKGKVRVAMLVPSVTNCVEASGDKGAFMSYRKVNEYPTPATTTVAEKVVDVTKYVKNGVLTWKAPAGKWRIMRYGYGLTGKENHPASPEATGLEVDKLNPRAVKQYYTDYIKTYIDASQGLVGEKGISHILNDSYEAGPQTWTDDMMREFKKRRGYDLTQWLPAIAGIIVKSSDESDRFLFDWRTTIGEMMAEYHYDVLNEILKPYKLKRYTESHETWRANLADGMDCKRYADVPMSATWVHYNQNMIQIPNEGADIRESASVAHIYGQNVAAAESFTARALTDGAFVYHPGNLKLTADYMMSNGLNLFVVHESAHQPVDSLRPGLGLGPYGQWFHRHEAWAEQASVWTKYLSRSCYLLQQGRFVADLAYYYGEDANITGVYMTADPIVPQGYNYDYVNKHILNNVVSIGDGVLTTSTGMAYKALVLNNNEYMSLPILKRIAEIADAGVIVFGKAPKRMASLTDDKAEFDRLVNHVWNSGKANVIAGNATATDLSAHGVAADVECVPAVSDVRFVHRTLDNGDIYWLSNNNDSYRSFDISFRTSGKKPVIWHPETGQREDCEYRMAGGRTYVKINMVPHDALFVMFLEPTNETSGTVPTTFKSMVAAVNTPWSVSFPENLGAPSDTTMTRLASLSESNVEGIKYFSGTATYKTTFKWNATAQDGQARYSIDLGEVHDIAEVKLNGESVGTLWHTPYSCDVTKLLRDGDNVLEVKVTNTWHNRMVGDAQEGVKKPVSYYPVKFFKQGDKTLPSGMVGPVTIVAER